jgi:phosphatidylserine synthase 2
MHAASSCDSRCRYAMTNFRDSVFRRPHPLFWRFIHGVAVLYALLLVFAVFQSPDDIRQLLTHIDASLGTAPHSLFAT